MNLAAARRMAGGGLGRAAPIRHQPRKSINEHRHHVQRANVTVLDKAATEILTAQMGSDDPERILYALELFTSGHSGASHPVVRGLLHRRRRCARRPWRC